MKRYGGDIVFIPNNQTNYVNARRTAIRDLKAKGVKYCKAHILFHNAASKCPVCKNLEEA